MGGSFNREGIYVYLWLIHVEVGLPWWLRWWSVCLQYRKPRFNSWVGKILWRRKWQPTPVLLPGKSHGGRSLVGYSPWDRKELDMTERLHFDRKHQNSVKQLSFNKNTTEWLSLHFTSIKNKLILKRDILTTNLTLFLTLFCSWGRKVNVQKRRNWNCSFL